MALRDAEAGAWRDSERQTQTANSAANGFEGDYDFPPTRHPRRELLTASAAFLIVVGLIGWGLFKLISLI